MGLKGEKHVHHQAADTNLLIFAYGFLFILYVILILFSLTVSKLIKEIPLQQRIFQPWLAWLMLIIPITYFTMWLVLPFGVGKALKRHSNMEIRQSGHLLYVLGLIFVCLPLLFMIQSIGGIVALLWVASGIVFWFKAYQTLRMLKN